MRDCCSLRDREWGPSAITWPAEQAPARSGVALVPGIGHLPGDGIGTAGDRPCCSVAGAEIISVD